MTKYFTKDGDDYVEVEETLLTESAISGTIQKRLEQQKRNEFGDYDELKEKAEKFDSTVSEFEGKLTEATEKYTTLESELGKAKLETTQVKLINEFKLSEDLAEFVVGNDEAEMRKRAEKLSKGLPGGTTKIDKEQKPNEAQTDSKKLAGKLFGSKSDD